MPVGLAQHSLLGLEQWRNSCHSVTSHRLCSRQLATNRPGVGCLAPQQSQGRCCRAEIAATASGNRWSSKAHQDKQKPCTTRRAHSKLCCNSASQPAAASERQPVLQQVSAWQEGPDQGNSRRNAKRKRPAAVQSEAEALGSAQHALNKNVHHTGLEAAAAASSSERSFNSPKSISTAVSSKLLHDTDITFESVDEGSEQPPEAGIVAEAKVVQVQSTRNTNGRASSSTSTSPSATVVEAGAAAAAAVAGSAAHPAPVNILYPPRQRNQIKESWTSLMRWSRALRKPNPDSAHVLDVTDKVVVFGGGSFGTAMAVALARQRRKLHITLLLRDAYVCRDINTKHINTRYLQEHVLPTNVTATTSAAEAIAGARYAIHAVPVQHSREFLNGIKDLLPHDVPIISVSKGLQCGTGKMMSELVPDVLGRKHPCAFLSGPSFAKEVMNQRPTGIVAASKDSELAREMQELFASPYMRVNTTTDVTGVEICGALKNVLAIAAGIVEGLELGNNAMAALVAQGCAEIRWLAEKMGAKPATVSGLSGLGDIMLTCYGSLSRNRSVGVRLGAGECLEDILASSKQVAEGVATAGVVVSLARKYKVSLPVLTAVAQVLNSNLSAKEAVFEIMNLPQIEER